MINFFLLTDKKKMNNSIKQFFFFFKFEFVNRSKFSLIIFEKIEILKRLDILFLD